MIEIIKQIDRARLIKYICYVSSAILLLIGLMGAADIRLADAGVVFIIGKLYEAEQLGWEAAYVQIEQAEEELEGA